MSPPWHCEWLHFWVSWTVMDKHGWTVMDDYTPCMDSSATSYRCTVSQVWRIWYGFSCHDQAGKAIIRLVTVELPTGGYAEKLSGGDAEYFWTSWLRLVQRHIYIILQAGMVVVYGPWKQGSSRCGVWNSSIWLNSWDLENIIFLINL